jgi:hypothetical protein
LPPAEAIHPSFGPCEFAALDRDLGGSVPELPRITQRGFVLPSSQTSDAVEHLAEPSARPPGSVAALHHKMI